MSEASFERRSGFAPTVRAAPTTPFPRGYGLAIGAGIALSLWLAIGWGVLELLG